MSSLVIAAYVIKVTVRPFTSITFWRGHPDLCCVLVSQKFVVVASRYVVLITTYDPGDLMRTKSTCKLQNVCESLARIDKACHKCVVLGEYMILMPS